MNVHKRVDSPCVGNCCLDENDVCLGCYRTLEEIKCWGLVDDSVRIGILDKVAQRSAARMERLTLQDFKQK